MRIGFVSTVFNEEKGLNKFLNSLLNQTLKPHQIAIVDGGSKDETLFILKEFKEKYLKKNPKTEFYILQKKGNRSVGRNKAIKHITNNIIICSDAGNILDKNWIKNITMPFSDKTVDVVAGYYKGKAATLFEKCLIPYVLVMEDKINESEFLPATRSIAFRKSIWKKVGKFPEKFSHNEDYVFANKLKDMGAKIVFEKKAIVQWIPRSSIKGAFIMFFRFALGDAEAGIIRDKVLLLIFRYILLFYLLTLVFIYKSTVLGIILILGLTLYLFWAVFKNYKYIKKIEAAPILIILQLLSDFSVLFGTCIGIGKIAKQALLGIIKNNKIATVIIGIYCAVVISFITWGLPNSNHPFLYHMDEWHQSQAVRMVFTKGTPNTEGSANGTMFHFYLTGLYLMPSILLGMINPHAINNSVSAIDIQQKLFIILRLNTLLFGIASIIIFAAIAKKFFKIHSGLSSFLITITPIWIMHSNYFKYDIALIFWLLVTEFFILEHIATRRIRNFYLAGFFVAITCATKISAAPLLFIYLASFFLKKGSSIKNIAELVKGFGIFIVTFLIAGVPDTIFGKGNILGYLDVNIFGSPQHVVFPTVLGSDWLYLFLVNYQLVFGPLLIVSGVMGGVIIIIKKINYKNLTGIDLSWGLSFIILFLSLIPLKMTGAGNRLLVLLPFFAIYSGIFIKYLFVKNRIVFLLYIFLVVFTQAYLVTGFISTRYSSDIRQTSSNWMKQNFKRNTYIGVIVPPIYENVPDLILYEYYGLLYNKTKNTLFKYENINDKNHNYSVAIVGNIDIDKNLNNNSYKSNLEKELLKENFEKKIIFAQNYKYFPFIRGIDMYLTQITALPSTITIFAKYGK